MKKTVVYIHGQGGNSGEAAHYQALFPDCKVVGLDYRAQTPWEARSEFPGLLEAVCGKDASVTLIANSIGACFAMYALADANLEKAFFISPIVDMERLILDMMQWANVTEAELQEKGEVRTSFGQVLSWDYLCYVRTHPITWKVPTHILYGSGDSMTAYSTVASFAEKIHASLTVMEHGEHWFHTEEQMAFLDRWMAEKI